MKKKKAKLAPVSAAQKEDANVSEFMDVHEVALQMYLTPTTIRRMCKRGEVPGAIKFGTDWRIKRTMFRAHLDKQLGSAGSAA